MNVAEKIYEQVKVLPEPTAQEVLDFVEFVKKRLPLSLKKEAARQTAETRWPDIILAFEGVPDLPPFEQDRAHLLPPSEDPLR